MGPIAASMLIAELPVTPVAVVQAATAIYAKGLEMAFSGLDTRGPHAGHLIRNTFLDAVVDWQTAKKL